MQHIFVQVGPFGVRVNEECHKSWKDSEGRERHDGGNGAGYDIESGMHDHPDWRIREDYFVTCHDIFFRAVVQCGCEVDRTLAEMKAKLTGFREHVDSIHPRLLMAA